MDKKSIHSLLQNALEKEIPSEEIRLWPDIKADFVARKTSKQGEKMMRALPRCVSRIAFATLVIALLLVMTLATPQGRAFAQKIIRFFTHTENTEFQLSPSQIVTEEPDPAAPTTAPPAPLISMAEAEAQAGFNAAELPIVPDGFNYLGARLYGSFISIEYEALGGGGNLILTQSVDGFNQSEWDRIPEDVSVLVKIGELDGEYVQGAFVAFPGETSAEWNPDASILRLRWVQDDVWCEMVKFGDVESIEYLDQDGMIALAESLIYAP